MSKLLYITASPRGDASESIALAETFLAEYRTQHPDLEVDRLDLWDGSLPVYGGKGAEAKMVASLDRRRQERSVRPGPKSRRSLTASQRPTSTCSRSRCGTPVCRGCSSTSLTQSLNPGCASGSTPAPATPHCSRADGLSLSTRVVSISRERRSPLALTFIPPSSRIGWASSESPTSRQFVFNRRCLHKTTTATVLPLTSARVRRPRS
jgi:Flavodoxin-like fold